MGSTTSVAGRFIRMDRRSGRRRTQTGGTGKRPLAGMLPATVFLSLQLILLATFAATGDDGDGGDELLAGAAPVVEMIGGDVAVVLAPAVAEAIGLRTEVLTPARRRLAYGAWVEVLDIATLVMRRNEFDLSRAAEEVSKVDMDTTRAEYRRLVDLGERGRIVAQQDLRRALGAFQRHQALVQTEQIRQATIRNALALEWGPVLADRLLAQTDDTLFLDLVNRREALLRLTLPPGRYLAPGDAGEGAPPVEVVVANDSDLSRSGTRLPARLLSPAPATDRALQGETWFLAAPADRLRTGMRVAAEVLAGADEDATAGTLVPEEAVVWHDGRPWVYAEVQANAFVRRDLSDALETRDGWFSAATVLPGDVVVVGGTTTLLSEEYRWQIPTEDDDDDD